MAASDITGTLALVLSEGGTSYEAAKEVHDQKIKATIDTVGVFIRSPDFEGARLKHYRSVAFRYDKLKRNYESMVAMACGFL
ncbi:hypothetical protein HW06_10195 [Pseudomonas aeruginosa]|nr:hypothetical protein HW06_10195 [Pseudomonas aeruginosa]